ncbi:MAG: hypothetical protein ACD_60C00127G0004 [uncultured bacterium]|nr:MAG: hypothetical protein ACD_60C00127G0004 [uncultured bacterium]
MVLEGREHMVNERYDDKYEGHEESEYHFSDEQANYEMDADVSVKEAPVAAAASKENLANKLKQHRRIIIGLVVFTALLGIVYKLVVPASAPVATDFAPQTTASVPAPVKSPAQNVAIPVPPVTQPAQTQPAPAAPPVVNQILPAAASPIVASSTAAATVSAPQRAAFLPPDTTIQNKNVLDRIATLEQQNTAMMNILQTQYAQKMSDTEIQNNQLRTQVQELNARVGAIEVAFRQLTKILRGMRNPASPMAMSNDGSGMYSAAQPTRTLQPKVGYTVQAIIPGRAWLKSESGDTVTVAEGDVLKDFGRIMKIDPYDGVVNVDTGNKVITLSYGVNGD